MEIPLHPDCDGTYVDFQGATRACTKWTGCGLIFEMFEQIVATVIDLREHL